MSYGCRLNLLVIEVHGVGGPGEVGAHGEYEHALLTHLYSCSVSGNGDMVWGVLSADCVVSVEAYWTSG